MYEEKNITTEENKTWNEIENTRRKNDRYWSVAKELEHIQFNVGTKTGNTELKVLVVCDLDELKF